MKSIGESRLNATLRWLLGLLLIWAALPKLANLQEFYGDLLAYRLHLPDFLPQLLAITLPWLELLCGLMLAANVWTRTGLAWAAMLFAVFTLATGQAWVRGLDISCGCFKLSLFGFDSGQDGLFAGVFESVGFAFFRALVLATVAIHLLRQRTKIASLI